MTDSSDPSSGGETVLVVDDLPEQTALAERILKRAGYIVLSAQSGGEAMQIIDNLDGAVDLLITDLRMPGMKGPDLALEIRRRYPEVRVLFVSGGRLDAKLPPGAQLLPKPFTPEDLMASTRRALDARH